MPRPTVSARAKAGQRQAKAEQRFGPHRQITRIVERVRELIGGTYHDTVGGRPGTGVHADGDEGTADEDSGDAVSTDGSIAFAGVGSCDELHRAVLAHLDVVAERATAALPDHAGFRLALGYAAASAMARLSITGYRTCFACLPVPGLVETLNLRIHSGMYVGVFFS